MTDDGGIFRLRDSGIEALDTIVPIVLSHLAEEVIDAVAENMRNSLERSRLRFAGVQARLEVDGSTSRILTAGYLQEYPGRIAGLAGPRIVSASPWDDKAGAAVVQRLMEIAKGWSIEMVQLILEPNAPFSRSVLRRTGFRKAADLVQMEVNLESWFPVKSGSRPTEQLGQLFYPGGDLAWRRYMEGDRGKWVAWLDRTYAGTLDCPMLNGIRSTEATLDGYLAASKLPPSNGVSDRTWPGDVPAWMGAFSQVGTTEQLVAGYILSPTDEETWELTYMGVDPDFRGQGLGRGVIEQAIGHVCRLGGRRLWLAVDDLNCSAKKLYGDFGFRELRHLEAWIAVPGKTIDGNNSGVET